MSLKEQGSYIRCRPTSTKLRISPQTKDTSKKTSAFLLVQQRVAPLPVPAKLSFHHLVQYSEEYQKPKKRASESRSFYQEQQGFIYLLIFVYWDSLLIIADHLWAHTEVQKRTQGSRSKLCMWKKIVCTWHQHTFTADEWHHSMHGHSSQAQKCL